MSVDTYERIVIEAPLREGLDMKPLEIKIDQQEDAQLIEINRKSFLSLCRTCLSRGELTSIEGCKLSSGETLSELLELCVALKVCRSVFVKSSA